MGARSVWGWVAVRCLTAVCLTALCLAGAAPSALAAQGSPSPDSTVARDPLTRVLEAAAREARASRHAGDEAFLDLAVASLPPVTVTAYARGADALLPFARVAALAELVADSVAADRWVGAVRRGGPALVVDATRRQAWHGTTRLALADSQVAVHDGELQLSATALAALLGVQVEVDWAALRVHVGGADSLPVAARLRREAGYRALRHASGDAGQVVERDFGDRPRVLGGFAGEYAVTAPVRTPGDHGSYVVALGGELLGGSLETRMRGGLDGARERGATTWSWTGAWEHTAWVRQLRAGDVGGTGLRGRPIRGVAVTNAPYRRANRVGTTAFSGELGPGWQVEAYRNGILVGVDTTDAAGHFAFDMAVGYGENPVDFVAYGPHGERRTFTQQYQLPVTLLPAGRLEYGLSGGACAAPGLRRECRATGNLDLRYGLTGRWVVAAGADWFRRDSPGARTTPYVGVTGAPLNAMTVELQAVRHGYTRGALRLEPTRSVRVSAEHVAYDSDAGTPYLAPAGRRAETTLSATLRPFAGRGDAVLVDGAASRVAVATGTFTHLSLSPSARWRTLLLQPYGRWSITALADAAPRTATQFGARASYATEGRLRDRIGPLYLTGQLEADARGEIGFVSASVLRTVRASLRVGGTADWRAGDRRPTLGVSVWWDHARVRSSTTVTQPAEGRAVAQQALQGSALWNASTRQVTLGAGSQLQQGALAGRLFVDDNGNGRRDAGEPRVAGMGVSAGGRATRTDARGEFLLTNLVPFESVVIALDTLHRADPSVVPGFATARIVPAPNGVRVVEVPFVPSGTLEGRVTLTDGPRTIGVPSLPLVVTALGADGRVTRVTRTTTFSDGGFYVTGLPPGDYVVAVAPEALAARRWRETAATARLAFAAGGVVVDGLVVRLEAGTGR